MDTSGSGFAGQYGPGGGDREEGRCFCGRPLDMVELHVAPTTGGQFQLKVAASDTIEYLKRLISKRLRVPKERICLLYKDRHLRDGTLVENSIVDGVRLTLLPSVETGLLTQRPEQSVMQALESLNDGQVTDFLSGKAPLNLTMRLGDHMMLIQLQLSTVSPSSGRRGSSKGSSSSHLHDHHLSQHSQYFRQSSNLNHCAGSSHSSCSGLYGTPRGSPTTIPSSSLKSPSSYESNQATPAATSCTSQPLPQYSPPHHHYHHHHHHHLSHHHHHHHSQSSSVPSSPSSSAGSSVASHSNFSFDTGPLVRGCPHQKLDEDPKAALDTRALAEASRNLTQTLKQLSNEVMTPKGRSVEKESYRAQTLERKRHPEKPVPVVNSSSGSSQVCGINVNTCSPPTAASNVKTSSKRQGAIIESMHHHGKGVYSGTFSGTLNPALQDRQGRPKRDISTIIHILNDLLCATPQYRRPSSKSSASSLRNLNKDYTSTFNQDDLLASNNLLHKDKMDLDHSKDNSRKEIDDSQVTRTKLKQLRFIMEQSRAQRKARREARYMPYPSVSSNPTTTNATTTWSSETTTLVTSSDETPQPMEVKNGEETDKKTLRELNSGTIVA